jgi:8-oxo-dGTP pyrophosphatase MutT (NUDIX family)
MSSLLLSIERTLVAAKRVTKTGDRRACVACILRRSPKYPESLDMLFILRARRGDSGRWDGQVAFPGGHVEAGESDLTAVARECEEEVGLHLTRGGYRHLGEVRQRAFRVEREGRSQRLVVCCHVFEQTSPEDPR